MSVLRLYAKSVSHFSCLTVKKTQMHTHTLPREDQRANMQEIGLRFYFGGVSDSG